MLEPIKRYKLVVSDSDKAQLFDNRQKIAKIFLAPTLYELKAKIDMWYGSCGFQETLDKLDFIPCIKEAEIAYMKQEVSDDDMLKYLNSVVGYIKEMRSEELYCYTFDDYQKYADEFDVSIVGTLEEFTNIEEIIEWIISVERFEEFGEKLREEFCKWLSEK